MNYVTASSSVDDVSKYVKSLKINNYSFSDYGNILESERVNGTGFLALTLDGFNCLGIIDYPRRKLFYNHIQQIRKHLSSNHILQSIANQSLHSKTITPNSNSLSTSNQSFGSPAISIAQNPTLNKNITNINSNRKIILHENNNNNNNENKNNQSDLYDNNSNTPSDSSNGITHLSTVSVLSISNIDDTQSNHTNQRKRKQFISPNNNNDIELPPTKKRKYNHNNSKSNSSFSIKTENNNNNNNDNENKSNLNSSNNKSRVQNGYRRWTDTEEIKLKNATKQCLKHNRIVWKNVHQKYFNYRSLCSVKQHWELMQKKLKKENSLDNQLNQNCDNNNDQDDQSTTVSVKSEEDIAKIRASLYESDEDDDNDENNDNGNIDIDDNTKDEEVDTILVSANETKANKSDQTKMPDLEN